MGSIATSAVDLIQRTRVLSLYKNLFKHLKASKTNATHFQKLLRSEFRQNSVSDSKYCLQKNELFFLGNAYETYLSSTQKTLFLYSKYCKGERSIEESARIVGLKLPKTPDSEEK